MRICIFATAYLPLIGGAEISVHEIAKRLPEFEFDLYTARIKQELPRFEKIGNVNVIRIGVGRDLDKKLLALHGAFYAREAHAKEKYDLVWSLMASYGGFAAISFKKSNRNIPYLLTLQEGDSEEHILKRVWGFTWKFKQIFSEADSLHTISKSLLDWGKKMGFKGGNTAIIPNGVDPHVFNGRATLEQKNEIYKKLDIPAGSKTVISVSRLVEKNGVGDLLEAFVKLPENTYLILAGDGELKNVLVERAKMLGAKNRVIFLGSLPQKDIVPFLASADVFCRPSLTEGFGNAFIEAMACGVPVVGTSVGGIADFIVDNENALVVPPKDIIAISKAITTILNNPDIANKISKGGIETAKNYSWDKIAKEFGSFIKKITAKYE